MKTHLDVEDLGVYHMLCQLHIEICDLSHTWPAEEKYELGSQIRRSSNSAPAQLAEKNDDRHLRNKIEGVNRSRGEAAETIRHLSMAKLKGCILEQRSRNQTERRGVWVLAFLFQQGFLRVSVSSVVKNKDEFDHGGHGGTELRIQAKNKVLLGRKEAQKSQESRGCWEL